MRAGSRLLYRAAGYGFVAIQSWGELDVALVTKVVVDAVVWALRASRLGDLYPMGCGAELVDEEDPRFSFALA